MKDQAKGISKKDEKRFEAIGERLKEIRKNKGYASAEKFAWQHDINRVQYWRMEKGQNFTLQSLFVVLDALDITLKEFFSDME